MAEVFSKIDLEQLRRSGEYQDRLAAGPQNEDTAIVKDFNHNFNSALSAIRRIIHGNLPSGVGNWYDAPSIGLSGLHQIVAGLNSQTWNKVFDNGSGILNVDIFHADIRLDPGRTWRFTNTAGTIDNFIVSTSGVLIRQLGQREREILSAHVAQGVTRTIPNSAIYTFGDSKFRNLKVYRNGQLLLPGSGLVVANENFNDYRELNASQVVMNIGLKNSDVIQYLING